MIEVIRLHRKSPILSIKFCGRRNNRHKRLRKCLYKRVDPGSAQINHICGLSSCIGCWSEILSFLDSTVRSYCLVYESCGQSKCCCQARIGKSYRELNPRFWNFQIVRKFCSESRCVRFDISHQARLKRNVASWYCQEMVWFNNWVLNWATNGCS